MNESIPYGKQYIFPEDIEAVTQTLLSNWLTQGPAVPRFEEQVAKYCQVGHGVATSSGTAALHLACLALGLGPGDRVWTSPISFVASANCARYCGAEVDFVDIDPESFNLCANKLAEKLADTRRKGGKLPKIVIPVHFAGQACEMTAIAALGKEYGFRIIEDAAHALGGTYQGQPVGCCEYSDITVFSFHPVKSITSAEGGMALTRDTELAETMRRLGSHGISRDSARLHHSADGPWYYEQQELGYNYRLSDLHAALGFSQMRHLPDFIARRRQLAEGYREALKALPLRMQQPLPGIDSAHHLFVIRVARQRRDALFQSMQQAGIAPQVHYIPIHTQPYYQAMGFKQGDFPIAEAYYQEAVSLPLFPSLQDEQQRHVIQVITQTLGS